MEADERKEPAEPVKKKGPKYVHGIGWKNGQVLYYAPLSETGGYTMGRAARREMKRIRKRELRRSNERPIKGKIGGQRKHEY